MFTAVGRIMLADVGQTMLAAVGRIMLGDVGEFAYRATVMVPYGRGELISFGIK